MKSALLVLALAGVAFSQTCTVITNVGCFTTASTKDSLTYHSSNGQMTHELCMALCFNTANTNAYAGLSLGINCYCGDPLSFSATTASNCTTPCGGSSLETCGGTGHQPLTESFLPNKLTYQNFSLFSFLLCCPPSFDGRVCVCVGL
eukprot:m.261591 g.261591  ORF g.261591 m.261591 type:complete len:147 (+) comp54613_c0_seq2:1716-2156(+)